MSNTAAPAQPVTPTAEEVVKPAPGIEKQDTDLTGSGEVATKVSENTATREKPEDIESPEEWLKNSKALNEKIVSEAKPGGQEPSVSAEEPVIAEQEAAPVEKPAEAIAPAEELEEPEVAGKLPQHRVRGDNAVEDMAFTIKKKAGLAGRKMSLTEAETEAKRLLGITEAAPVATPETTSAPAPRTDGKPATVADTEAKIAELRAERKKAKTIDLDLDKEADLTDEIERLTEHKTVLAQEQSNATNRQRQSFDNEAKTSQARAVEAFPECAKPDSQLTKEMIALDAEWKEDGNPLYHSANKPFLLAQRVSDRLKRAGVVTPVASAASPQPVKPTRPVQPAAPIASGTSRTTQAAPQNGQLVEKLNKISTPADYEATLAEMSGKRY